MNEPGPSTNRPMPLRRSAQRGVAVIMVLMLLAITMGLTYAMVRTQNTAVRIERNADLHGRARQAALSGLMIGLKKMHTSSWLGVNTTLSGNLATTQTYSVTFSTGDPTLTSSDSDWSDYPWRVTLVSTGKAFDTSNSNRSATHTARAVVRLVPRKLADEPSNWSDFTGYTLFQYYPGTFEINVPFRATGKIRCSWIMSLGNGYYWSEEIRDRYLTDLNTWRLAGGTDYRPFNGTVYLPYLFQVYGATTQLNNMGVTTSSTNMATYSAASIPSNNTYRLYPGGKYYNVETMAQECRNASYGPNTTTNPLGIFARSGNVYLYDNATIQGTMLVRNSGDVYVVGSNVTVKPVSMPALSGNLSQSIQLPVLLGSDDFFVQPGASGKLQGMIAVAGDFQIAEDGQTGINLEMLLQVAAQNFLIYGRSDWDQAYSQWSTWYNIFKSQISMGIRYFPAWLAQRTALSPVPRLVITPDPESPHYHWNNLQTGIYVAGSSDGGLRWEIVSWTDNP